VDSSALHSFNALPYRSLASPQVRMGDTGAVKNLLKGGEADPSQAGATHRGWTPLHIACWGTSKPQNDKDIVEAILMWAQKSGKDKEAQLRGAADTQEGLKPVDLAKQRRDSIQTAGQVRETRAPTSQAASSSPDALRRKCPSGLSLHYAARAPPHALCPVAVSCGLTDMISRPRLFMPIAG
jgi:hypothetical protein